MVLSVCAATSVPGAGDRLVFGPAQTANATPRSRTKLLAKQFSIAAEMSKRCARRSAFATLAVSAWNMIARSSGAGI